MTCPKCGGEDMRRRGDDGEYFPTCEDCGFTEYDEETLQLQAEVGRDYEQAKRECWPNKVPSYRDYLAGDRGEEQ